MPHQLSCHTTRGLARYSMSSNVRPAAEGSWLLVLHWKALAQFDFDKVGGSSCLANMPMPASVPSYFIHGQQHACVGSLSAKKGTKMHKVAANRIPHSLFTTGNPGTCGFNQQLQSIEDRVVPSGRTHGLSPGRAMLAFLPEPCCIAIMVALLASHYGCAFT